MKKIFFTSLLALIACFSVQAQVTELRMATLIQGSKTSVYYGENAFVNAYNAADDTLGVIILSSGKFSSPTIQKSISVYGAGMEDNKATQTNRTTINGFNIQAYKDYDEKGQEYYKFPNGCHFEGMNVDGTISIWKDDSQKAELYDLYIKKCKVYSIDFNYATSHNTLITQSYIVNSISPSNRGGYIQDNFNITNCYLGYLSNSYLTSRINIDHCIVSSNSGIAYYTNNIIFGNISANSTAYNNIFGTKASMSSPVTSDNNWMNIANNGIFEAENEDGTYAAGKTFALKYPKKYIGTDGTEVGLNGGTYKWNPTPCLPRITSSEIDTRTTTDGKLKVSIKVEAQTGE